LSVFARAWVEYAAGMADWCKCSRRCWVGGGLAVALVLWGVRCQAPVARPPESVLPAGAVGLADWMSVLNAETRLSALSIPGTHDSGATHEPLAGTAACQSLSVGEQLAIGIRFLDIRCRHMRDRFAIYHGVVDQELTFEEVVGACRRFLEGHRGECIVMSINEEGESRENTRSFARTWEAYAAESPGLWYVEERVPTLREAAGKIVLFRRFAGGRGLDASRWPDNRVFSITGTRAAMRIQDRYVVPENGAKWNDIRAMLEEARTGDRETLFVNFTSGYRPGMLGIPNIPAVLEEMHARLAAYFKEHGAGRFGVVLLDFADASLSAAIVRTNVPGAGVR
jgi:1-phosphatidylinositol phosphodiesterase